MNSFAPWPLATGSLGEKSPTGTRNSRQFSCRSKRTAIGRSSGAVFEERLGTETSWPWLAPHKARPTSTLHENSRVLLFTKPETTNNPRDALQTTMGNKNGGSTRQVSHNQNLAKPVKFRRSAPMSAIDTHQLRYTPIYDPIKWKPRIVVNPGCPCLLPSGAPTKDWVHSIPYLSRQQVKACGEWKPGLLFTSN